jgi:hypothetical protein
MPSDLERLCGYFTAKEARRLKKDASKAKMTVSNYLRVKAGFEKLERGAAARKKAKVKK